MLPRFHIKDFATVFHYLGTLVVGTGALMVIPFAVAMIFGEFSCAVDFLMSIGICLITGSLLRLFTPSRLDRRRSLLLCGFGWVVIAIMAAIPLYFSGGFGSFLDALFDAVSSLTTTGVSVVDDIDRVPYAQVTWRAILSLVGAQLIIVIGMYLGFFGTGGYSARDNAKARHESTMHSLPDTLRYVLTVSGGIVLAGALIIAVICLIHGFGLGDSIMNGLWLASNAYSTGSFIPHTSSLIFYHSTWLDAFVGMIMLLGALNFSIYALILAGKQRSVLKNTELALYAVWMVVLVVIVSVIQCREGFYGTISGLFDHGTFMMIAGATTSGMQTVYPAQLGKTFTDGAFILLMAAMFVGSSSCSTGGGVKIFRVQSLIYWFAHTIKRALLPVNVQNGIRYEHFGSKRLTPADARLAMVITVMYIIMSMVGTVFFIAHGYTALESICESISYVTNAGMTTGVTAPAMTVDLKVVAMLQMWAGRLEFIALIAVIAGLVISVKPASNTPAGVTKTRKAQNREQRRKRFRSYFKQDGGSARAGVVIICLALAVALACAPLALADGPKEAEEDELRIELEAQYREAGVAELVSATERMDGELIQITGEVMGMGTNEGRDRIWVNIKQGRDMIGVLMSSADAERIQNWGGYCRVGDMVTVRGVFHLACPEHSGELEVHATSVSITSRGFQSAVPVNSKRSAAAALLIIIGLLLATVEALLHSDARHRRAATIRRFLKKRQGE